MHRRAVTCAFSVILCASLGLPVLTGVARAGASFTNFDECSDPTAVPDDVFVTIAVDAGFDFGDLPEKTCKSITKKGVSTCKTQVKSAAKCNDVTAKSNYDITAKQCAQLDGSDNRKACKSAAKNLMQLIRSLNKANRQNGLDDCVAGFEAQLQDACINGVSM